MKSKKPITNIILEALVAIAILLTVGCFVKEDSSNYSSVPGLYITDTVNGNVYFYDFDERRASDLSVFSVLQDATDAIYFFNGKGYIAVGANLSGSNIYGVYTFDPEDAVPTASRIGISISAQYIAFYSDTKAYVTSADFGGAPKGVFTFNPSNHAAGLTGPLTGTIAGGMYLQDIEVGLDDKIYVADNGNGAVLQINPATDAVTRTDSTSSGFTTGLLPGTYLGENSIYAANTSTVDAIRCSDGNVTTVANTGGTHLVYHAPTSRMYMIGWSNSYVMNTSGAVPWTAVEIMDGAAPFGGSRMVLYNDLVYITSAGWASPYNSKLYVIDAATQTHTGYSPVPIMDPSDDGASGVGVYVP